MPDVSSDSSFEFNIAQICRMAFSAAGLMSSGQAMSGSKWAKDLAQAMDFLEMDLKALQAAGVMVRPVDFYALDVVAGQAQYELPSSTLDLIGNAMWTATGDTYQTPVMPVQRATYQGYANKATQAQPTSFYADRQRELNVFLYPTPSESGVLVFQRHRLLANARDPSKAVDLERHWTKYIVAELGKWLAYANSLDSKGKLLGDEAIVAKRVAMGYSKQRGRQMFINMHRTGWNR